MSIIHFDSISEVQQNLGLGNPKHPLITCINWSDVNIQNHPDFRGKQNLKVSLGFYMISMKKLIKGSLGYGRKKYDFNNGILIFTGPGQIMSGEEETEAEGWAIFFHPDLIRASSLEDKIDKYTFFSYDVNEALHLSEDEEKVIEGIAEQIRIEYSKNIDVYTKDLIVSQLDLLLNYSNRFYGRQFITRTSHNQDLVSRFNSYLKNYISSEDLDKNGLPSVRKCAESLAMSPDYLSDMLKKETGKNAQEHIHYELIEKAKSLLLGTSHIASEIAFMLGFEYSQYFSKLFKKRTGMTPAEFRKIEK